jgi:hypothetical protein
MAVKFDYLILREEHRLRVKSTIFWDITPCSPLIDNRRFEGAYRFHLQGRAISRARIQREGRWPCLPPAFTLVSCSAYFSILKMEAICFFETSVDNQRTTRRYIPEDRTLYNHRCEKLKSYKGIVCSNLIWGIDICV